MKDSAVFKVMLLLLMASVGLPASAQPTKSVAPAGFRPGSSDFGFYLQKEIIEALVRLLVPLRGGRGAESGSGNRARTV